MRGQARRGRLAPDRRLRLLARRHRLREHDAGRQARGVQPHQELDDPEHVPPDGHRRPLDARRRPLALVGLAVGAGTGRRAGTGGTEPGTRARLEVVAQVPGTVPPSVRLRGGRDGVRYSCRVRADRRELGTGT